MKSYLFTIGIHEDFAIRRLVSTRASKEDLVLALVKSPMTGGNRRAIMGLNAVMSKMGLKDVIVKEVRVEGGLFDVVDEVGEVLREVKDPLIVDVSGGESKMLVLGVVIALAVNGRVGKVYVEEEDEEGFHIEDLRTAVEGITGEMMRVLKVVTERPGIRHEEIAEVTGKKLKTVMNLVGVLKKKRLVYQKGRGEGIYPTKLGVVVSKGKDFSP